MKDIEIIIVNDGTTDRSIDFITEYQRKDNRFKIIEQKNMGLSYARNKGIAHARGEYILFVDSDDWISVNTCELIYRKAQKFQLDVLIFNYYYVLESDLIEKKSFSASGVISGISYITESIKENTFSPPAWNKLIRLELAKFLSFQIGSNYEDIAYSFSLMLKAQRVSTIEKQLYYYRRFREGAITQRLRYSNLIDLLKIYSVVENNIKQSAIYKLCDTSEYKIHKYERISMEFLYKLIDDSYRDRVETEKIILLLQTDTAFKKLSLNYLKHGHSIKHKLVLFFFTLNPKLYIFLGRRCYPLLKKIKIAI